jgi:hypothetical protein
VLSHWASIDRAAPENSIEYLQAQSAEACASW